MAPISQDFNYVGNNKAAHQRLLLIIPIIYAWMAVLAMLIIITFLLYQWCLLHNRVVSAGSSVPDPESRRLTYYPQEVSYDEALYSDGETCCEPCMVICDDSEGPCGSSSDELNGQLRGDISYGSINDGIYRVAGEATDDPYDSYSDTGETLLSRNTVQPGSYLSPTEIDDITHRIRLATPLREAMKLGVCLLCNMNILPEDQIRVLSCYHNYHNLCILKYLILYDMSCPICREPLPLI